ncbi:hypothetical protein D3C87_78240 [compost metagenome]
MKEADEIIEQIGNDLESDNNHSIAGIPEELWNSIKEFIPEENHLKVAEKFKNVFYI